MTADEAAALQPGTRIHHVVFGAGVVSRTKADDGSFGGADLILIFDQHGPKVLAANLAAGTLTLETQ